MIRGNIWSKLINAGMDPNSEVTAKVCDMVMEEMTALIQIENRQVMQWIDRYETLQNWARRAYWALGLDANRADRMTARYTAPADVTKP